MGQEMNKELIIYRHAKSDWQADFKSDFERPLSARGIKSAEAMGRILNQANQIPQFVLCSSAVRTCETLKLSKDSGNWNSIIQYEDDLYYEGVESLLKHIRKFSDRYHRCMIVSHQPKCSELVSQFINGGVVKFSTANMAKINFWLTSWKDIHFGSGELSWLLQPKLFI